MFRIKLTILNLAVLFVISVGFSGCGGTVDEGTNDDTLPSNVTFVEDSISQSDEIDFHQLEIICSGTLKVYTESSFDTFGALYNSDGQTILITNDDDGEGDNFLISYEITPGDYWISVEGFDNTDVGDYIVYAEVPICTDTTNNNEVDGTIRSSTTNKVWLDKNLGASRQCISQTDESCFGDYYQWGRDADGHEKSNSLATQEQVTNLNDTGNRFVIATIDNDWDWAQTADNSGAIRSTNWNPCPTGFRLPTKLEIEAENLVYAQGAYDQLKLPMAGYRNNFSGDIIDSGGGTIWSSTAEGVRSYGFSYGSSSTFLGEGNRAEGKSVRCIQN